MSEPFADARDMFAVHTMFRREFGLMPELIRSVDVGDTQRAAMVADHFDLMSLVLDIHHRGEDRVVWPRLHERVPAEIEPIVGTMEQQHAAIHHGLGRVEEAVRAWHDGLSVETRVAAADAVGQLLPVLKEHLALEEDKVVPLIEQYLTAAEYALLVQEGATETPPEKLPTIFGMIMYEGDPEVIDVIVGDMPPEVQPVIRDLASHAYATHAKELYGTATPTRIRG